MRYSAVIIAKNEAANIGECIKSLSSANEVIVLDDLSTDNTAEVAAAAGASVSSRASNGKFAEQKNAAIALAKNDWVLIIDADERLTEAASALIGSMTEPEAGTAGFSFRFRNYIGARWLRYGGLYPDRHIRLFNHRLGRYGSRQVHEELVLDGATQDLDADIIHHTYASWAEYLQKVKSYSRHQAKEDFRMEQYTIERPIKAAAREFLFRYWRLEGFKDAMWGVGSALLLAYYQYLYQKQIARIKK